MSSLQIFTDSGISMNSKEIADLVESEHSKVRQSIERLAKREVIQLPPMGKVEDKQSLSPNNRTNVYLFEGEQGKRDSIVVVAQLSPEFTARLVDRWQELETKVARQNEIIQAGQNYWKSVRYDLAVTYNKMMQIIELLGRREGWTEEEVLKVKWREADMLNLIVMGMTSREIRGWYDIKLPIRDSFPNKILAAYHYIEQHNVAMLVNGTPYDKRMEGLEYLLSLEFPDVLIYRNAQKDLIRRRTEDKDWDLMPTHPKDWPSMRFPNEMMLRYNISPEELETSAQLMLEGEQ